MLKKLEKETIDLGWVAGILEGWPVPVRYDVTVVDSLCQSADPPENHGKKYEAGDALKAVVYLLKGHTIASTAATMGRKPSSLAKYLLACRVLTREPIRHGSYADYAKVTVERARLHRFLERFVSNYDELKQLLPPAPPPDTPTPFTNIRIHKGNTTQGDDTMNSLSKAACDSIEDCSREVGDYRINDKRSVPFVNVEYIYGYDATQLSKEKLLELLRRAENEKTSLGKVETKSTYVAGKIAELDGAIANIVRYLDKE